MCLCGDSLPANKQLCKDLIRVRQRPYIRTERGLTQVIRNAQVPLGSWYKTYLEPLQPWLEQYARVVIAPDGLLHHLPFACLYDVERRRYLIETHEICRRYVKQCVKVWSRVGSRYLGIVTFLKFRSRITA